MERLLILQWILTILNFFEIFWMLLNCQFHQQYRIIKNVFFWIWTQRTWTSASDRYSHPVLYFILNTRIHIISGKFRLRSTPRVRFLFSQIFHDERHRSFSMSTLFISSNLSRTLPPHPCFLWLQDVIVPWFTVTSQHHENRVWDWISFLAAFFFMRALFLSFIVHCRQDIVDTVFNVLSYNWVTLLTQHSLSRNFWISKTNRQGFCKLYLPIQSHVIRRDVSISGLDISKNSKKDPRRSDRVW